MIPALFGNIFGGSLCCGVYFWWMYLADVDDEEVPQGKGVLPHGHDSPSDEESQMESR
jgi:hypothetical protein